MDAVVAKALKEKRLLENEIKDLRARLAHIEQFLATYTELSGKQILEDSEPEPQPADAGRRSIAISWSKL